MKEEDNKTCSTTGGWGPRKTSSLSKRKFRLPAIWPAVYVWLLVGVIFIISRFF